MVNPFHRRQSIRLQGHDYTQAGAYFITIVTARQTSRFGEIANCEMRLNLVGQLVQQELERLPARFPGLALDAFVVMPNHIHSILFLYPLQVERSDRNHNLPNVHPGSLGAVVRAYKSSTTLRYRNLRVATTDQLWQRNYYEHIIRGPDSLERIQEYILTNPAQWELDHENPDRKNQP